MVLTLVSNGFIEGNERGKVLAFRHSDSGRSGSHWFFGLNTEWSLMPFKQSFNFLRNVIPDELTLGTLKDFYPKKGASPGLFTNYVSLWKNMVAGDIIYYNEGPLHPKTCWDLWDFHSCCSPNKRIGIFWNKRTDLSDLDTENFNFPWFVDNDGKYTYSWEEKKVSLNTHSSYYNLNFSLGSDFIGDEVMTGYIYFPKRQEAFDTFRDLPDKNIDDFELHHHTEGDKMKEYMCLKSCTSNHRNVCDSTGLPLPIHKNVINTLFNAGVAPSHHSSKIMIMTGQPLLKGFNLELYNFAYHRKLEQLKRKYTNKDLIIGNGMVTQRARKEEIDAAGDLFPVACRKMYPQLDKEMSNLHPSFCDVEDILDYVWEFLSKLKRRKNIRLENMNDVYATKRNCYGRGLLEPIVSVRQCVHCGRYPPLKYKWVKGYCEDCQFKNTTIHEPYQKRISKNLHFVRENDEPVEHFEHCVPLAPANPYYKEKPIREGLKNGDDFSFSHPGFKKAKVEGKIFKPSAPAQLIGAGISTRARTFNLSDPEVEARTLQVRIFAKPNSSPLNHRFPDLFRNCIKHNLLQPANIKPIPLIWYDFSKNGFLCKELKDLNIIKHDNRNFHDVMTSLKTGVDMLNDQIFHIDQTASVGYDIQRLHWLKSKGFDVKFPPKTWISSFEPRKKTLYYQTIMAYPTMLKPGKGKIFSEELNSCLPNIDFTFFLKRELDTHGCNLSGSRPAMNPRVICNPSPISQVIMGPYMRVATKHLHEILSLDNCGTYFGGLSPGEGNLWAQKIFDSNFKVKIVGKNGAVHGVDHVVIENDFSKFDSTYSEQAFWFVREVYKLWGLPMDNPLFQHVLDCWQQPKGKFRSGTKVSSPTINASGRADTALMNALINYFVQLTAYVENFYGKSFNDVTHDELDGFMDQFRIAVLGDDSLTVTKYFEGMETFVSDVIAEFGFEARDMKTHRDPRRAVFLGNRLYPVLADGVKTNAWGPTIGRRLFKLGTSSDIQPNPMSWLLQISEATLTMASFVPILGTIARSMYSFATSRTMKQTSYFGDDKIYKEKIKYNQHFISPIDLKVDYERIGDYMLHVYELSQQDIEIMQNIIYSIESYPCVISHPLFDRIVSVDTG